MMEVNDEINPLVIREFSVQLQLEWVKQPTWHDPHWNKDFGWGLVHGHDANWTTQYLNMTGISTSV